MPRLRPLSVLILPLLLAAGARAQQAESTIPPPRDIPYAGTIKLEVDATNLSQRIFRVKETLPAQPGPLTLLYPMWVPGGHTPRNPLDKIAGIRFSAGGKPLAWRRDPLDVAAFHLDVPAGANEVVAEFEYLTPTAPNQGRIVMTPSMLNLQPLATVLYPAGYYVHRIPVDMRVTYPAGWTAFTALHEDARQGDTVDYEDVPLDILVDSPVYAGRHARRRPPRG